MTQGAWLSLENENIVMSVERETLFRSPLRSFESVVCFGNVMVTPPLMGYCSDNGIPISFFTEQGRFLARVDGPVRGSVILRRKQYRAADDQQASLCIAKNILAAKVANSRSVVMRFARETSDKTASERARAASSDMAVSAASIDTAKSLDELRGVEGDAARSYFSVFDDMIVAQKDLFKFSGRTRRPPTDEINAMLSFLYSILAHDITSALEGTGLDPCVGFLHRDRPGRPSLALDMMEEFRAHTVDRLVLSMINRKQIDVSGFEHGPGGSVKMADDTRRAIVKAWQERKQEELTHPFTGEKMRAGLVPHIQARLLARHLRGDIAEYPPYFKR